MTTGSAAPRPGRIRALAEIVAAIAGLFLGSAAIGALVVPYLPASLQTPALALGMWGGVAAGAGCLRLSKSSFGRIGFARPRSWPRTLVCALGAAVLSNVGAVAIGQVIAAATDWRPLDVAYIRSSIEGNALAYLVWIAVVVWGSAAFGEELFARGFVLERLQAVFGRGLVGIGLAVIAQAALFGALHAIQGPTGVVITAWVGVVLAGAYFASGRNLWAPILAHGAMDTASLTLMFLGTPLPGHIA